jgi:hypothetical protein
MFPFHHFSCRLSLQPRASYCSLATYNYINFLESSIRKKSDAILKIKGQHRPSLSCGVKGYARLVFDPLWLRPFKPLSAVGEISTDKHQTIRPPTFQSTCSNRLPHLLTIVLDTVGISVHIYEACKHLLFPTHPNSCLLHLKNISNTQAHGYKKKHHYPTCTSQPSC